MDMQSTIGPLQAEQSTLRQEISNLFGMIYQIKEKVLEDNLPKSDQIDKNPQSSHKLENIRNSIIDARVELEGILHTLKAL